MPTCRLTSPHHPSARLANFRIYLKAICDADYKIIMWTMNCPGSQNDRTALKFSGFPKLLRNTPAGYYILGDAAYPASDSVLVPFLGTALSLSQDAFNFFQSQCRIAIEQTFGIMVGCRFSCLLPEERMQTWERSCNNIWRQCVCLAASFDLKFERDALRRSDVS